MTQSDRFPLSAYLNFPAQGGKILKGKHKGSPLRSETPEHGPVLQGLAEGATRQVRQSESPRGGATNHNPL